MDLHAFLKSTVRLSAGWSKEKAAEATNEPLDRRTLTKALGKFDIGAGIPPDFGFEVTDSLPPSFNSELSRHLAFYAAMLQPQSPLIAPDLWGWLSLQLQKQHISPEQIKSTDGSTPWLTEPIQYEASPLLYPYEVNFVQGLLPIEQSNLESRVGLFITAHRALMAKYQPNFLALRMLALSQSSSGQAEILKQVSAAFRDGDALVGLMEVAGEVGDPITCWGHALQRFALLTQAYSVGAAITSFDLDAALHQLVEEGINQLDGTTPAADEYTIELLKEAHRTLLEKQALLASDLGPTQNQSAQTLAGLLARLQNLTKGGKLLREQSPDSPRFSPKEIDQVSWQSLNDSKLDGPDAPALLSAMVQGKESWNKTAYEYYLFHVTQWGLTTAAEPGANGGFEERATLGQLEWRLQNRNRLGQLMGIIKVLSRTQGFVSGDEDISMPNFDIWSRAAAMLMDAIIYCPEARKVSGTEEALLSFYRAGVTISAQLKHWTTAKKASGLVEPMHIATEQLITIVQEKLEAQPELEAEGYADYIFATEDVERALHDYAQVGLPFQLFAEINRLAWTPDRSQPNPYFIDFNAALYGFEGVREKLLQVARQNHGPEIRESFERYKQALMAHHHRLTMGLLPPKSSGCGIAVVDRTLAQLRESFTLCGFDRPE